MRTNPLTTLMLVLVASGTLSCGGAAHSVVATAAPEAMMCTAAPPVHARPAADEGCGESPAPTGLAAKMLHQLRYHQRFPARGPEVLAALAATAELDAAETAWVAGRLPALRFASGRDVMVALFPDAPVTALRQLGAAPTLALR